MEGQEQQHAERGEALSQLEARLLVKEGELTQLVGDWVGSSLGWKGGIPEATFNSSSIWTGGGRQQRVARWLEQFPLGLTAHGHCSWRSLLPSWLLGVLCGWSYKQSEVKHRA